jgi:hypothetical protein
MNIGFFCVCKVSQIFAKYWLCLKITAADSVRSCQAVFLLLLAVLSSVLFISCELVLNDVVKRLWKGDCVLGLDGSDHGCENKGTHTINVAFLVERFSILHCVSSMNLLVDTL